MTTDRRSRSGADPFLSKYQDSELRVASEFLSTWFPFLSKDLCHHCVENLSLRIRSIDSSSEPYISNKEHVNLPATSDKLELDKWNENNDDNSDVHSIGSWEDGDRYEADTNSIGGFKDMALVLSGTPHDASTSESVNASPVIQTPKPRLSWADMAQEDELEEEEEEEPDVNKQFVHENFRNRGSVVSEAQRNPPELSREKREHIRFLNVRREKDFICLERVNGRIVNIVGGLELHCGIFSAVEQKRIVDYVYDLQKLGKNGQLKERTYSAPLKWMKGKGPETIQFGCCYNYATDEKANHPPGILQDELVDPLPHLFKVIIRRLVKWHVLPPSCVPDSCMVNIYEEGDCKPPHIDTHDFVRPFCIVSFLSEIDILFGLNLKVENEIEFSGSNSIPLPVGSALVLKGNGADIAKHCVPAVPTKRISITFRRMDQSKRPANYQPEADLQGLQPLSFAGDTPRRAKHSQLNSQKPMNRQAFRRQGNTEARGFSERGFSERSFSERGFSERASSERGFSERASSERGFSERGFSERSFSERGFSERASSERGFSERASSERGFSERGFSERGFSEGGFSERSESRSEPRSVNQNRKVYKDGRRIRVSLGS